MMIEMHGQLLLRISRNYGMDAFQRGAHASKYNTLVERHVSRDTMTCRRTPEAFGEVHKASPTHDQANCRRFAKDIFEAVDPDLAKVFEAESGAGESAGKRSRICSSGPAVRLKNGQAKR
jgi:hypothetical protein